MFANGDSAVVAVQVPADRILSTPRSGVGCLSEHEFVVLAPKDGMPADEVLMNRAVSSAGQPEYASDWWKNAKEGNAVDVGLVPPDGTTWSVEEDAPPISGWSVGDGKYVSLAAPVHDLPNIVGQAEAGVGSPIFKVTPAYGAKILVVVDPGGTNLGIGEGFALPATVPLLPMKPLVPKAK